MPLAYRDGNFIEKNELAVGVTDFGFSRGLAVFDLIRVYGGMPFRLDDHLERLMHGAKMLGISCPLATAEIAEAARRLCATNKYPHSAVKLYLTAGECANASSASFAVAEGFTPHFFMLEEAVRPDHPEAPYGLELYRRGQKLKTVPCERSLPTVKSTSYALGYHAARVIAGPEWDEILFTGRDGGITESTRSNFFCVIDSVLCTPKEGMLFGVTRKVVLELAARLGVPVTERLVTAKDCARATEAFLTGSICELLPARQIDDHVLPITMDGPVFKKLRAAFTAYVAESTALAKAS
jgi:branched-subunit amino acid aminotransferase/4-amino-4-deoxychorismate lyase